MWDQPPEVVQRFLLLIPFLAGKRAVLQQVKFDAFMRDLMCTGGPQTDLPLTKMRFVRHNEGHHVLVDLLKKHGLGKYGLLGRMLRDLIELPDPVGMGRDELAESVAGFGMKSASMFVAFSRPEARVAVLDTHVLRWLGATIPRTVGEYLVVENWYLERCDKAGMHPAVQDFAIWLDAQPEEVRISSLPALERAAQMVACMGK